MYSFLKNTEDKVEIALHDIEHVEQTFNLNFPKVLRDYYVRYNAVKMNLCVFTINKREYEVTKIIPLKSKANSFEMIKKSEIKFAYIPNDFMPLARNRGGDYYYWDKKNQNVFLVYSDAVESPVKICDNIADFFSLLEHGNIVK